MRSSLGSESWQKNHNWNAKDEWDHRRDGFPLAKDLRWRFAKDWGAPEKIETAKTEAAKTEAAKTEAPAAIDSPVEAKSKTDEKNETAAKSAALDSKTDSAGASAKDDKHDADKPAATPADKPMDKPAAVEDAPHWDGFWPLGVAEILHPPEKGRAGESLTAMDEGLLALRRLAHTDNLVGWNAAILWAQQDPSSAVEVADVLQKLVVSPPQYMADAAEESQSAGKTGSSRLKEEDAKKKLDAKNPAAVANGADPPRAAKTTRAENDLTFDLLCGGRGLVPCPGSQCRRPHRRTAPAGRLLEQTSLANDLRAELFAASPAGCGLPTFRDS